VHSPNAVPFAKRDPQRVTFYKQGAWSDDCIAASYLAILGRIPLRVSCNGINNSGLRVNPPNAVIADVGNIDGSLFIERYAVWLVEERFRRWPAIAAEARASRDRNRRNCSRLAVHSPDDLILHFDEVHIAV